MKLRNLSLPLATLVLLASVPSPKANAGPFSFLVPWWRQSDQGFAESHAKPATDADLTKQSTVAWMLFARLNEQVTTAGKTNSVWETWKSNPETFPSSATPTKTLTGARRVMLLQKPKSFRLAAHLNIELVEPSGQGGEEVTRNPLSYNYIVGKGLNTVKGVWAYLGQQNAKVDLPIGAVETKAYWIMDNHAGDNPGAYKFTDSNNITYSLVGLHIMCKMAPLPSDPFHSETPSWFWTTFEYKGNPGLANAQKLITYKDALPAADSLKLLQQAGLGSTPFVNYRCNGTQIRYSDASNPKIILGNTKMEAFAGKPSPSDPSGWTKWNTSCHTCHGEASGDVANKKMSSFEVLTGKLTSPKYNSLTSFDFIWSIPFNAK